MSRTVDERVVSMKFDNSNFEKNVGVTMSTLDKLKEKCKFTGAIDGFKNLSNSAKNVDMSGLNSGVETVRASFSALDVVAVTALANITNSAINAGKNLVKSLSVDQISSGWEKYNQKTSSVQTIMNATGKSIDEVNGYLSKLMWFSDETSYGFTDMTSALATMTSSGGDIEKLIPMIEGVANATAYAGKGAAEFSRIMQYSINQAYSLGYMQLQDWKTIQGATADSKQLKEALIAAGEELGTIQEKGKVTAENFTSTLSDKWLTTGVMEKAFGKFSEVTQAAYDIVEDGNNKVNTASVAYQLLSGELGETSKEYQSLSEEHKKLCGSFDEVSVKAAKSAQEAKTFSEAIDATKDAMGSAFMRIFETIFGNYEQAKKLWTDLSNTLYDVFVAPIDNFQEKLQEVMENNPFKPLLDNIQKVTDPVKNVVKSLEDYSKIVDEIINGKWGNGQQRWDALAKAGYDWAHAQNLVNEKLGSSVRHATDYKEAQDKLTESQESSKEVTAKYINELLKLSDAELKAKGFTDEQITSLRELEKLSKKTGLSIKYIIENVDELDGRTLLINSFKNVWSSLVTIFGSVKKAWSEIFPDKTVEILFNIIAGMHKLSMIIKDKVEKSAEDLTTTFKGLFSILDIVADIVKGTLRAGFKVISTVLGRVSKATTIGQGGFLKLTAAISENIIKARQWVKEHEIITKVTNGIAFAIISLIDVITKFVKATWELPVVQKAVTGIKDAFVTMWKVIKPIVVNIANAFADMITAISSMEKITFSGIITEIKKFGKTVLEQFNINSFSDIGKNIVEGLKNGISNGLSGNGVFSIIIEMAKKLIDGFKEILGIHSPSTVFEEFGENIIDGLVIGLQNGIGLVVAVIKKLGSAMKGAFEGLNFMDVFLFSTMITTYIVGTKILKQLNAIAKTLVNGPLSGLNNMFDSFAGFMGSLSKVAKAKANEINSQVILNIAKAVVALVGSVIALSLVDPADLKKGIIALGFIAIILAGLVQVSKVSKDARVEDIGKVGLMAIAMGVALTLMAKALKSIGDMDESSYIQGLQGIITIVVLMSGLALAFGYFAKGQIGDNIDKAGVMFLKMAVAVGILAVAMKIIGSISDDGINKGISVIAGFTAMYGIMIAATKGYGTHADKAGKMFLSFSVAVGILAVAMKILATISVADAIKGGVIIGAVAYMFKVLVETLKDSGENITKAGLMFLAFSASIAILAVAMKILASISIGDAIKGGAIIAAFAYILKLLVEVTKESKAEIAQAGLMFLEFGAAVAILAIGMKLLASMSGGDIAKGLAVVSGIGAIFAALTAVSKFAGEHAGKAGEMFMKFGIAIGILAISIRLVASLSNEEIAKGLAFVSGVTVLFSALTAVSYVAGAFADKAGTMLIKASAAILILVGCVVVLSLLDPMQVATGTAVVTAMVAMFAVLMKACVTFNIDEKAIGKMYMLAGVVAVLALIVGLLAKFSDPASAIASASALSVLLLSLSASLKIISLCGDMALKALAPLAAMSAVVALLAVIVGVLSKYTDPDGAIKTAVGLSALILSLSGACVLLGVAGKFAEGAFIGIGALVVLIAAMGGLMVAIGALQEHYPAMEKFLDTGIVLLNKIGNAIGSFFGNIVGGFLSGISDGLPKIAQNLSDFMTSLQPFLDQASNIDTSVVDGVKALSSAILTLTAAGLLESINKFFGGSSSLADFATQLQPFGQGIKAFADEVSGVDVESVKAASEAAKAIAEMTKVVPSEGGVKGWLMGEKNLADFGGQLPKLAAGIKGFADNAKGIDVEAVTGIATAASSIVDMTNKIPNEGGMKAWFVGDSSVATYSAELPKLGKGIKGFADSIAGIQDVSMIKSAAKAAQAIAEMTNHIPKEGGLKAWFTGETSISKWADKLPKLGQGLSAFAESISGISDIGNISAAAKVAKTLAEMSETAPKNTDKLANFGTNISKFGTKLKECFSNASGINQENIELVKSAAKAIKEATNNIQAEKVAAASASLKVFIDAIKQASSVNGDTTKGLKDAVDNITNAKIGEAIKNLNSLKADFKTAGEGFVSSLSKGMSGKKGDAEKSAKSVASAMVKALKSKNSEFTSAGKSSIDKYASGISKNTSAKKNAESIAKKAADGAKSKKSAFESAGKDLGNGLVIGINAKQEAVYKAGYNLGKKAVQGEKDGQKSASPSKATKQAGKWLGEGLIIGIKDMYSSVYRAGYNLGDKATNSISNAISQVYDLINTDIDAQPTIKPVMDLSNITSGANTINDMLAMDASIGAYGNVRAINSMMSQINQNGSNDDVVSAITKLSKQLSGSVGGNTYTINGVTYDDGSNIKDAVETLIRAANMERRM